LAELKELLNDRNSIPVKQNCSPHFYLWIPTCWATK